MSLAHEQFGKTHTLKGTIMVYNNQITGFTAPIADAVGPLLPYISTKRLCTTGNPRGFYMTPPRETFCWNPNEQKETQLTERASYLIVGDVGASKSSFEKIAAFEDSAVVEDGHPGNVFALNTREIAGKDEYGMLAQYLGTEMTDLNKRINPFSTDLGFTASDHLDTVVSMHESSNNGTAPVRNMKLAARVALAEMLKLDQSRKKKAGIETLADLLLNVRSTEAVKHISSIIRDQKQEENKIQNEEGENALDQSNEEEYMPANINWTEFADDAGALGISLLNFLGGEYGDAFGGSESFGVEYGKRFFGLNLAHRSEQVQAFTIEYILRLQGVTERNHDPRFKFDIETWDEIAPFWNYPGFARTMSKRLKFKRGDSTVVYHLTQNLEDFEAIANPAERKLAMNAVRDFGAIIYCGLESPSSIAYAAKISDLTPLEQKIIQKLRPGQYGIKFPGEPVQFVYIDLNPVRRHLIETNTAVIEAIKRRRAYALGR